MIPNWLVFLPPFIVVLLTCFTQLLPIGLIGGILCAALIARDGHILEATELIIHRAYIQLVSLDNLYLYAFLVLIASLVVLINKTKGPQAFTRLITKKIRNQVGIEMACVTSSCILSIDDYLSILTVGHVMRSITDHFAIARAKLAYIIHALSGPIVLLCPISSWVATITAYLQQGGINNQEGANVLIKADPFYIYLHTLPYMFYSLITFIAVLFIIKNRLSFGPMQRAEQSARNQFSSTPLHPQTDNSEGSMLELAIPLVTLFGFIVLEILYFGNYRLFGGNNSFIEAFKQNTYIFFILATAGAASFIISYLYSVHIKRINWADFFTLIQAGFDLMKNVILMVFLISILSVLLRVDLQTGNYLASILKGNVSLHLLPIILFIISLGCSLTTGSSWSTFGLLLPIAIPMVVSLTPASIGASIATLPLLYQTLGAIFSGGVCGDHISLFSETTSMSAGSTNITPLEHFKTQLPYALPVIGGCSVAFIVAGQLQHLSFWNSCLIGLVSGIIVCVLLLMLMQYMFKK